MESMGLKTPAELAGGIDALCLSFPLVSMFGLKVLQESREGIGRLVGSRQMAPGIGANKSYSGLLPGLRVEPLESIC